MYICKDVLISELKKLHGEKEGNLVYIFKNFFLILLNLICIIQAHSAQRLASWPQNDELRPIFVSLISILSARDGWCKVFVIFLIRERQFGSLYFQKSLMKTSSMQKYSQTQENAEQNPSISEFNYCIVMFEMISLRCLV